MLAARMESFEFMHRQKMNTQSIAQMISATLYSRRFFPYYTFNVVAGIDEEGKGENGESVLCRIMNII